MGINLRTNPVSEMDVLELPYNDCYVKDRQAMYRDYDTDMSARDLIRAAYKGRKEDMPPEFYTDDGAFDEIMYDNLQFGVETFDGIMAMLYGSFGLRQRCERYCWIYQKSMILRSLFKVWRCKQCVIALRKNKRIN